MERIFYNGKILTMAHVNGKEERLNTPEAILVKDGIIKAVGSYNEILQKAGEKAEKTPKDVLIGFGYDHNFLKENAQPDKRVLDQVSAEIPIFILHISGHLACANSAALELAHITADTPDPEGGVIGRLANGQEPSGYVEEAGMRPIQLAVMPRVKTDYAQMLCKMQEIYISNGITTVQDGATSEGDRNVREFKSGCCLLSADVF